MSARGRFQIPSIQEMEKSKDPQIKTASLFEAHKSGKSNISPKAAENRASTRGLSKSSDGNSQSSATARTESYISKPFRKQQTELELEVVKPQAASTATKTSKTGSTIEQQSVNSTVECSSTVKTAKSISSLIVSPRQRGNPILKHVRNVPWEFGDIVPDYVMGQTTCALYLSLRYHALNPNYIHERLKQLAHSYQLRVLLAQVDTKDPHHALKELGKICILADCTLVLAWTPEEAGRYLETYKSYENKPPELIMEKTDPNYLSQLTDCLTTVRRVNKTDAMTLLTAFGSVDQMIEASEEDLALCSGLGPQKAKRLHSVFHEPFLAANKRKVQTRAVNEEMDSPTKMSTGSPMKTSSEYITRSPWKKNTVTPTKKS